MNPTFGEFLRQVVLTSRNGGSESKEIKVDRANGERVAKYIMYIGMPNA